MSPSEVSKSTDMVLTGGTAQNGSKTLWFVRNFQMLFLINGCALLHA